MNAFKQFKERIWKITKIFLNYFFIIIAMIAVFTLGFYFKDLKNLSNKGKPVEYRKSEVTVAIDESNNVMIINKNDGTYILLEDSIGVSIFGVITKNIWGSHQQKPTTESK